MSYPTCNHLKEDGVYCASPALHNQNFCYFHLNIRARRLQMARTRMRGESCRLQLPVLEDMHAVQIALTQVLDALADDRIDPKRAGLMLYALQQSATNLNSTPGWKGTREQVEYNQPMRALETSDVATQFDLPKGVDLDLPAEAALQAAEQQGDSPQKPKEHVRLARMPQRTASQADAFYHIPKKLGLEKGYDEETYHMARMLFDMQQAAREAEEDRADEERRSRHVRPAGSFNNPVHALASADVG
jgi:hypothetical protein